MKSKKQLKKRINAFLIFGFMIFSACEEEITQPITDSLGEDLRYYPLSVGNTWIYEITNRHWDSGESKRLLKKKVIKDTLVNGKVYCLTVQDQDTLLERIDSLGVVKRIYDKNQPGESSFIDLTMNKGDVISRGEFTARTQFECDDESYQTVLGIKTNVISIRQSGVYDSKRYEFAGNIGLIRYGANVELNSQSWTLLGAVIDGNVIGDTATVN